MAGIIKLIDNYGEVVAVKHIKSPTYIQTAKDIWRRLYKNIDERNFIVEMQPKKQPGPKKKPCKAIGLPTMGRKVPIKPHLD